jgi:amide synthase
MFSVDSYLACIGFTGSADPSTGTLRELHKRHLIAIPFNNAERASQGTASLKDVDVDLDVAFDRVVRDRRGGVCFELNGLFRELLRELGFDVAILSAGVRGPGGTFGPDLEHMFLGVRLDGDLWLADVGFAGPGYLEPLRVTDQVQEQHGCQYRVIADGGYYVVDRWTRTGGWRAVYRFRDRPRSLTEWNGTGAATPTDDPGWNWEGELVAADTVIQARSFDSGQMVLIGKRYVKVDDGREEVRVLLSPADHDSVTQLILGRGR